MLSEAVVFHHPKSELAVSFARELATEFGRRGVAAKVADVWGEFDPSALAHVGLIVCIGGDGTVLRAARLAIPYAVPILGVNMGRLGFLTDLSPSDCFDHVERIVAEDWRTEERLMVHSEIEDGPLAKPMIFDGLNDLVVSRRLPGRPVYVDVHVDRARLATYRCDGIIIATPTGSTGYSLSAGGPILTPEEHHLVMTPVSAHLALGRSIVLQPDSLVEMHITSDHGAYVSMDGQEDVPITSGCRVTAKVSEHTTRFVRFRSPTSFYTDLAEKLEFQLSSSPSLRA